MSCLDCSKNVFEDGLNKTQEVHIADSSSVGTGFRAEKDTRGFAFLHTY